MKQILPAVRASVLFVISLLFINTVTADDGITLELSAGNQACVDAVVSAALPPTLARHDHWTLVRADTGTHVPVQVDRDGEVPRIVWIVRDTLDAGAVRQYRLTPALDPSQVSGVTITDDGQHLLAKVGSKPVLRYNYATVPAPDPEQPYYSRSGYIHPLYNPSGQIVTDDFNPDHAHQHGIMLAWRQMTFDGRSTNGWDQKSELGKVEHATLDSFGGGPVFGVLKARLRHVDLTAPAAPVTAIDETWVVRIYAIEEAFLFDITSTQSCASDKPVSIDTIHYGGMTIRGHADWHERGNFDYLTDQGKTKADGNQTRPRWVDLFGPIAGQTTGTLVMDHNSNFRFPQPVRLHPTMPYFCFTPASVDSFTLRPGKPYVSRYRYYVHDGSLDSSVGNRLWQQYVDAPKVRVVTASVD